MGTEKRYRVIWQNYPKARNEPAHGLFILAESAVQAYVTAVAELQIRGNVVNTKHDGTIVSCLGLTSEDRKLINDQLKANSTQAYTYIRAVEEHDTPMPGKVIGG